MGVLMTSAKQLAKNIRDARRNAGLSAAKLGEAAGTSGQMVRYYETAHSEPTVSKLLALCRVLKIAPDEMLKGCR